MTSTSVDWDPAGSGPFLGSAVGDFDGDGFLDAVSRRGSDLEVILAPTTLGAVLSGFCTPNAFTVVYSDTLKRDTLIVAESSGLNQYSFDPATRSWSAVALPATSGWATASRLHTRAMPGGAAHQILGVMANQLVVRAMTDVGSGYVEEPNPVFTTTQPIRDLDAFDQENDGTLELALMHPASLTVIKASGAAGSETWAMLTHTPLPGFASVETTRGTQGENEKDWIVWVVTKQQTGEQYTVVISDAPAVGPTLLGAFEIVRIAAGDWTGDGASDLALSWQVDQRMAVVPNDGSTAASFDLTAMALIDLTNDPLDPFPTNNAQPLFADLDNDTDLDLCLSVQVEDVLHVELSAVLDATAWMPTIYQPESNAPLGDVQIYLNPPGDDVVQFQMGPPDQWPTDENGNDLVLDLEVDVWNLTNTTNGPIWLDRTPYPGLNNQHPPVDVDFETEEDTLPFTPFYFWRTRYVQRDAGGAITFSSPAQIVGLHAAGDPTLTQDGADADQTLVGWGGIAPVSVIEVELPTEPEPPNTRIGSALSLPRLPPRPANDPPI